MENNLLVGALSLLQKKIEFDEPTFPSCCSLSSKLVSEEFYFNPIAGYVMTKKGPKEHAWNETKDNKLVDLTLFQFNGDYSLEIPKIIFLDKTIAQKKYGYLESKELTDFFRKFLEDYDSPLIDYPDFDKYKL